jgi:hypothetical protein
MCPGASLWRFASGEPEGRAAINNTIKQFHSAVCTGARLQPNAQVQLRTSQIEAHATHAQSLNRSSAATIVRLHEPRSSGSRQVSLPPKRCPGPFRSDLDWPGEHYPVFRARDDTHRPVGRQSELRTGSETTTHLNRPGRDAGNPDAATHLEVSDERAWVRRDHSHLQAAAPVPVGAEREQLNLRLTAAGWKRCDPDRNPTEETGDATCKPADHASRRIHESSRF